MQIMITLQGDARIASPGSAGARSTPGRSAESIAEIHAYLVQQGTTLLGFERFDTGEVATLSATGDEPAILEHAGSLLGAVWTVDVASRAAAVELARGAPGRDATLEIREAYTPQDFGAPPDDAPTPPPPPIKPGHARYIAFVRQDAVGETSGPKPEAMAMMGEYMEPLVKGGLVLGGQGLKASAKGTRVRRAAAQRFVLDGPFAESKELVGGYMIIQARSLDDAVDLIRPWLAIHRAVQGVPFSAIEVRRLA